MVSTFTPNINLEEPARGDDVGTWDTPVNSNMSVIDLVEGGIATISGAAGSQTLAAAQYRCKMITINSTLLASIQLAFPSSFIKSYEIQNICTGSSAFTVNLAVNASPGQQICCPPGEIVEVVNDGVNMKFKNLGRIGSYMDWVGSSMPNWISGCTVPPYLDCDGSGYSSVTYPVLSSLLGGGPLPDMRGRTKHYLNEGTGRLTAAGAGIDGNTNRAVGGSNGLALSAGYIPTLTSVNAAQAISVALPTGGARLAYSTNGDLTTFSAAGAGSFVSEYSPANAWALANGMTGSNSISVAFTNATVAVIPTLAPGVVSGLCLIRAG